MLTYHLQTDGKRQMIDDHIHEGWKRLVGTKTVNAKSWIHAKRKFGFELTDMQERML